MTIDHEAIFQRLNEDHQILDEPQFVVADVCKITGTTPKAIEHFVDPKRGMVRLMGDWVNPGTGKRRRFTGEQALMIAAAYAVSRVGFPQRWSVELANQVARRATGRITGLAQNTHMTILTYPLKSGDWAFEAVYRETETEPKLPLAVLALDVDRLIDETLSQLLAIVNGDELPDFSMPDPVQEPMWFAPNGGNRSWEKSPSDNWVYVGLSEEETRILMAHEGFTLDGDELVNIESINNPDCEMILLLMNRREEARFAAIGGGAD